MCVVLRVTPCTTFIFVYSCSSSDGSEQQFFTAHSDDITALDVRHNYLQHSTFSVPICSTGTSLSSSRRQWSSRCLFVQHQSHNCSPLIHLFIRRFAIDICVGCGWIECAPHNTGNTHQVLHITHHTSHITHHTSHITHHTSHITHHTSHFTRASGLSQDLHSEAAKGSFSPVSALMTVIR